jgi:perosamine synthetase
MNDHFLPEALDFQIPPWPGSSLAVEEWVLRALRDGDWGKYEGRYSIELQSRIASQFGQKNVTLCSSGTIAVELALRGLGVQAEREVILAGYDFPGNFRAIEAVGAIPVLVDPPTGGIVLDVGAISTGVSDKTAAVIVSHLHGDMADMLAILEWSKAHGISVLEDACQCPGAKISGSPAGSFGDAAVLSFGGSKLLSAGRGGAIMTNSERIQQRMRIFQDRGNLAFPLSELQSAAILPQLDSLEALHTQRSRAAQFLSEHLRNEKRLRLPIETTGDSTNSAAYYKFPLQLARETRDAFCSASQRMGIPIFPGFRGFAARSSRRCRIPVPLTHSMDLANQLALLHHPALLIPQSELSRMASAICKLVESTASCTS